MYFKQIQEIIDGTKTQTRRVAKDNEKARHARVSDGNIDTVHTERGSPKIRIRGYYTERLKWQVGRDYAVSPGRGKCGVWWHQKTGAVKPPTESLGLYRVDSVGGVTDGWQPLRIRLLEIRREPLRDISRADAFAEGMVYAPCGHSGYGTKPHDWAFFAGSPEDAYGKLWNSINTRKGIRWGDNPDVWVLRFEVVR